MQRSTNKHAAAELKLYIDNDYDLYSQTTSILKNLATKKARGQYKHDLAVKAFGYLVEAGAKKYAKEAREHSAGRFDPPWHKMFGTATRKRVATELTIDFKGGYALGNYDQLLPRKYQAATQGRSSALASSTFTTHALVPGTKPKTGGLTNAT